MMSTGFLQIYQIYLQQVNYKLGEIESKLCFFVGFVGRIAQRLIWIFEMADTSFQPTQGYVEFVARRDRRALIDVLKRKLPANSVIHSDEWRDYYNFPQFVSACIQHNTVNQTYNFVDTATDAHIQVSNKALLYVI